MRLSKAEAEAMGLSPTPKKKRTAKPPIELAGPDALQLLCKANGLLMPKREYRFDDERKWRFDYAWLDWRIALEVDGGIFGRGKPCPACKRRRAGAHSSVKDMLKDIEKMNVAQLRGWKVMRCIPDDVKTGKVLTLLRGIGLLDSYGE